jgi:magnesium-protoporphyrin O-methyltransferase
MSGVSYVRRTGEIERYFDRTAFETWKTLTGDQPVSGIRATVRKGRDSMRSTLSGWLPEDLTGWRILDAGCGSGVLSLELMARGADVVGIDLSAQMITIARQRASDIKASGLVAAGGQVEFFSGDMLDTGLGSFDAVVAMDVLIHYTQADAIRVLEQFAERTRQRLMFTLAPSSGLLNAMLIVGKAFPRSDRAPAIYPTQSERLVRRLLDAPNMADWNTGRSQRVSVGFYKSQAMEVLR